MIWSLTLFITFCASILTYVYAPNVYNEGYCDSCFVIFTIGTICFLKIKKKNNYFDFDTLFIITSYFIFFFFPTVVYPLTNEDASVLLFPFNTSTITRGTALATIGLISYYLGSISYHPRKYTNKRTFISAKGITVLSLLCFVGYYIFGGLENMRRLYAGERIIDSGPAAYLLILSTISALCIITLSFNNQNLLYPNTFSLKRIPKLQFIYILVFVILLLGTGSRTVPMQLMLCWIALYAYFYHAFSFKTVAICFFVGVLCMFGILVLRSEMEYIIDGENFYTVFLDLFINGRNTYAAIDYVDSHNITYGASMSASLLSPIPFLQNIVFSITGFSQEYSSSAYLLTTEALGARSRVGVGTNIIADLYLSFGIIGVILGMYIGGKFIAYLKNRANYSIYGLMAYAVMLSYAIYIVRAEYFFFIRAMIWGVILLKFAPKTIVIKNEYRSLY